MDNSDIWDTEFENQCLHGLVDPRCSLVIAYAGDYMDSQLVEAVPQPTQPSQVVQPVSATSPPEVRS